MTLYGDLDLSLLDELPPGRAKITTKIIKPKEREQAYAAVRAELQKGRQAYVICPRIEEPDPEKVGAMQARSAKAEAKRLQQDVFPEYEIGLFAWRDDAQRKRCGDERILQRIKLQILVATSVVESRHQRAECKPRS